ncbi:Gfo/Idh/MocA family protein [Salegentibacter maritimus]|uniref:Gfo/Idh/MocA family protein n=1 Tax=Salegentibacter maritimus TaxID=2794347 RepID=UPI0018E4121C|nr:Gfo/Idh/MocA family oxidoreductase [Salegentibacter maritimus]MBI6116813.1 Gfo/Idh/MocA family oxidoreductase [Salegentibacter maritimus]
MQFQQQTRVPEKTLPVAIIGAGGIVDQAHLPAYQLAGFPVLGIYDVNLEKAQILQEKFKSVQQVFNNLEELIEKSMEENAVFDIAVPANFIAEILEQLPDGTPVLIQKPMGENLEKAEKILEICKRKKLISGINFQLRYAPYMIAARDIIKKGLIGEVYDLELMVCVFTPWKLWNFLFELPRTEILYHSIHYLDLVRSFIGNPSKIYASTIGHPKMKELASTRSTIILNYDEYTQARIITNHGHEFGLKNQQSYFKIEGTKGAIRIQIGLSLDYPKGMPPTMEYILLDDKKPEWTEIPLIGGWFPHAFIGTMADLQNHYLDPSKPFPHCTEDAYETMKLVELAYKSSDEGGTLFK